MSVGTNLSPLATQICTLKFSLRKGLYIFPLLNMIHLQFTISNVKISPCTLSNTISSLSSSFASVLPTHRTPQGLWPQNSQPSLFLMSGERSSSILVASDLPWRKQKENSTDYPSTCIMRRCLLSHCNEKRWSVAKWDLTQLYFLSHLFCLYRKWEDYCLSYEVWVTLQVHLSPLTTDETCLLSLDMTYSIRRWKVARGRPFKCLP